VINWLPKNKGLLDNVMTKISLEKDPFAALINKWDLSKVKFTNPVEAIWQTIQNTYVSTNIILINFGTLEFRNEGNNSNVLSKTTH
jgi:nucleoid DNA-binding protein